MVFMAVANARREAQSELGALHEAIKLRAQRREEERKRQADKPVEPGKQEGPEPE